MTYDEAIAIRARDLSGSTPLHPLVIARAIWTIREGKKGKKPLSEPRYYIDQEQVRLLEQEVGPVA